MVTKATKHVLNLGDNVLDPTKKIDTSLWIDGNCTNTFLIDGTRIGSNTPCDGSFTNLTADDFFINDGGTFNLGTGVTVNGNLTAKYADIAERYESDKEYEPGTIVTVGGDKEITTCREGDPIFSVVSTQPAFVLNGEGNEGIWLPVVAVGRVPVKIIGPVKKGQRILASYIEGVAYATDSSEGIGWILADNNDVGIIREVEVAFTHSR